MKDWQYQLTFALVRWTEKGWDRDDVLPRLTLPIIRKSTVKNKVPLDTEIQKRYSEILDKLKITAIDYLCWYEVSDELV